MAATSGTVNTVASTIDTNKTNSSENEKKSRFKVKNVTIDEENKTIVDTTKAEEKEALNEIDANKSLKKHSRFTVKTVAKEDEKSLIVDNEVSNTLFDYFNQQSLVSIKLEKLVKTNYQLLLKLLEPKSTITSHSQQHEIKVSAPESNFDSKDKLQLTAGSLDGNTLITINQSSFPPVPNLSNAPIPQTVLSPAQTSALSNPQLIATQGLNTVVGNSINGSNISLATNGKDPSKSSEKDKSYGKQTYYLSELKKEIDYTQKQRKEIQLEMQRLREKCQRLEDNLSMEQAKTATLEERLERSKSLSRTLQSQTESQQKVIEQQQQQIEILIHGAGLVRFSSEQI